MNIAISKVDSTMFGARYLNVDSVDKLPTKVSDAIYKCDAIDEFLKAGKPKTFWNKLKDLFRKDEILEVSYAESIVPFPKRVIPKELLNDPYVKACNLLFTFRQRNGSIKKLPLASQQVGVKRQAGSVPKEGEHYAYKPPLISAEANLIKQIEDLKDFESLMI